MTRGQVLAIVEEIPAASDRVALATSRIEAQGRLAQAGARAAAARKKLARMRAVAGTVSEREVQDVQTEVRLADTERAEAARSLDLFDKGIPEKRRFSPWGGFSGPSAARDQWWQWLLRATGRAPTGAPPGCARPGTS